MAVAVSITTGLNTGTRLRGVNIMEISRDKVDYITVKYGKAFLRGGTKYISELIEKAVADGSRQATVTGNWDIESHINIPSDFTLVLDGCNLKMADATFDNMFVNEHHGTEIGKTAQGTDRNIKLIGKNGVILYGGTYNGLSERTAEKDGMPPIYKNSLILFTNVDGFETAGLALHNFRWWAVNHIFCRNGHIHDIILKADDICIDERGNVCHGLATFRPDDILVKQANGICLCMGSRDITIENVSGFACDDTVLLINRPGKMETEFAVEGLPGDLCNITLRKIHTCALNACVKLQAQASAKLHDVLIDDVLDISDKVSRQISRGLRAVHIDSTDQSHCCNITVQNIRSRGKHAVYLEGNEVENIVFKDIAPFDGGGYINI